MERGKPPITANRELCERHLSCSSVPATENTPGENCDLFCVYIICSGNCFSQLLVLQEAILSRELVDLLCAMNEARTAVSHTGENRCNYVVGCDIMRNELYRPVGKVSIHG